MKKTVVFLITVALDLAPCFQPQTAAAATLTVTNLNDSGPGSLRNTIAVSVPADTVNFAAGLTGTLTLTSGQLAIASDLTILGPGQTNLTISGNLASRVFYIAGGTVNISGLTIADGTNYDATTMGGRGGG